MLVVLQVVRMQIVSLARVQVRSLGEGLRRVVPAVAEADDVGTAQGLHACLIGVVEEDDG